MSASHFPSEGGDRAEVVPTCRNCGAGLQGRFCAACGQAAQQTDDLRDLWREWLQRAFASKPILWSTLKLLVCDPAQLTREWWAGRRSGLMSPIRTLFAVLLVGSITPMLWGVITGRQSQASGVLLLFTWEAALVLTLIGLRVLPSLLPKALRRSSYETATFALYEGAFLGLLALAAIAVLLVGDAIPALSFVSAWLAPTVLPVLAGLALVHFVVHLWKAFGVSLVGALARVAALSAFFAIGMAVAGIVVSATGIASLVFPVSGEQPTFHRE